MTKSSSFLLFASLLFLIPLPAKSNGPKIRVVFELSSGETGSISALATSVSGLRENAPALADIRVVAFNSGVRLFLTGETETESALTRLADSGVDFALCQKSLNQLDINTADLLGFARIIKDGIKELEKLEEQGWARVPEGESYVSDL